MNVNLEESDRHFSCWHKIWICMLFDCIMSSWYLLFAYQNKEAASSLLKMTIYSQIYNSYSFCGYLVLHKRSIRLCGLDALEWLVSNWLSNSVNLWQQLSHIFNRIIYIIYLVVIHPQCLYLCQTGKWPKHIRHIFFCRWATESNLIITIAIVRQNNWNYI